MNRYYAAPHFCPAGPRAPPSLGRLALAPDHAMGRPVARLALGAWRRDAAQLRRVMNACGPVLEILDLAPATAPRGGRAGIRRSVGRFERPPS